MAHVHTASTTARIPRRLPAALGALALGATALIAAAPAGAAPTGTTGGTYATGATGSSGATGATPTTAFAPTGPYRTVKAGTTTVDGKRVTWTLRRAPGSGGTTCWRFVAKPAGRPAGVNAPDGARCMLPLTEPVDPVDVPMFVQSNARRSPYGFVAFTAPKGTTKVRVGTEGGTFRTVSGSSPYVVVTKKSPLWVDLTLPGGPKLACPAGVLIDKSDLRDPILTKPSIGVAWFCDEV